MRKKKAPRKRTRTVTRRAKPRPPAPPRRRSRAGRPIPWAACLRCSWPRPRLPGTALPPASSRRTEHRRRRCTRGHRWLPLLDGGRGPAARGGVLDGAGARSGTATWASLAGPPGRRRRPERVLRAERLSAGGRQAGALVLPRHRARCRPRADRYRLLRRKSRRRRARAGPCRPRHAQAVPSRGRRDRAGGVPRVVRRHERRSSPRCSCPPCVRR